MSTLNISFRINVSVGMGMLMGIKLMGKGRGWDRSSGDRLWRSRGWSGMGFNFCRRAASSTSLIFTQILLEKNMSCYSVSGRLDICNVRGSRPEF
jgi:hypothetical protein